MNVLRLHAVRVRVLEAWEVNPVVTAAVRSRAMPAVNAKLATALPAMRKLLVKFLASALYGDTRGWGVSAHGACVATGGANFCRWHAR